MIDEEETINRLYNVFRDGYRPSRTTQSYKKILKIGNKTVRPTEIVNCFAHAFFNLTNGMLVEYGFKKEDSTSFGDFPIFLGPNCCLDNALYFVKNTGLRVVECDRSAPVKQYKSWKVDAYFDVERPDFHFFLQEAENIYSHKIGFMGDLRVMFHPPELIYKNYEYQGTYMVTNKYTSSDNKHNKPLFVHTRNFTKI